MVILLDIMTLLDIVTLLDILILLDVFSLLHKLLSCSYDFIYILKFQIKEKLNFCLDTLWIGLV